MFWTARIVVHRRRVPLSAGVPGLPLAAGSRPGRLACVSTARNAWASIDRVMCRYQASHLRTW